MMTKTAEKEWTNKGRWLAYSKKPLPRTKEDLWPALNSPQGLNTVYVERIKKFVDGLNSTDILDRIKAAQHGYKLAELRLIKADAVIRRYKEEIDGAMEASKRAVEGKEYDKYCGRAIVYVSNYKHELARALWARRGPFAPDHWSSRMHAAAIEIAAPPDSQSMTGWEESARAAAHYLCGQGIPASSHSWAD